MGLLRHFCEYGEWACELVSLWRVSMKDSNLSSAWVCRCLVKRMLRGREDAHTGEDRLSNWLLQQNKRRKERNKKRED